MEYKLSDEDARIYISLMFEGYLNRKAEKRLYSKDGIPQEIIREYYKSVKRPDFDVLARNFKNRYMYNENKLEDVHPKEEQKGLLKAYEFIFENADLNNITIDNLTDIHELIYSKTEHPEAAREYRNHDGVITEYDIDITPYYMITSEMNKLRRSDEDNKKWHVYIEENEKGINVPDILEKGLKAKQTGDVELLLEYIEDCVKLHCKITKIHPFRDGNGRAARVFLNLMFRYVNIPPTYIENREKQKYNEALRNAQTYGNFADIINFYMYKICDSIIALDVKLREDNNIYIDGKRINKSGKLSR